MRITLQEPVPAGHRLAVLDADGREIQTFWPGATVNVDNDRAAGYELRPLAKISPAEVARRKALSALKASDADMARVVEDVIACLQAGDTALSTLPQAAREKLAARQAHRVALQQEP